MMMKLKVFLLVLLLVLVNACDKSQNKASQSLMLKFGDKEPEVDPYQTRLIITPDYMRFDDGEGTTDYLLFDRRKKTIYSVVQSSKSITVITSEPADVKPPFDLKLSHKTLDDMQDAPTMNGVKPQHHVYLSGEQVCFEVLSVPGFLPAYTEAMMEFNTILANDAALTMNNMPADLHNGCNLGKNIFAPNRHLQAGFPIQLWGPDGSQSVLLDFKEDYVADKTLFEIPSSYDRLNIWEIRAKLAK